MINTKFEVYKITREIKRSGKTYEVFRRCKNEFGELSDEIQSVGVLVGLYHEENSYVEIKTSEATQYRNKKQPKILSLFSDIEYLNLKLGDIIDINGKTFTVSSVTNIQEWNIVIDISLEEVVVNVGKN